MSSNAKGAKERQLNDLCLLLQERLNEVEVDGSFNARVLVGTGLQIAVEEIEHVRIEMLVEGDLLRDLSSTD
jgi:hypothetical protein